MFKLESDKKNEITFEMQIENSKDSVSEVRLIIESSDFNLNLPGEYIDNQVKIKTPVLESMLEDTNYTCHLEVIIGNQIYKPLTDSIELVRPTKFKTNIVESKAEEQKQINITVKPTVTPIVEKKEVKEVKEDKEEMVGSIKKVTKVVKKELKDLL